MSVWRTRGSVQAYTSRYYNINNIDLYTHYIPLELWRQIQISICTYIEINKTKTDIKIINRNLYDE